MTVLSCLHEAMSSNRFVLVDKIHVQVTRVKKYLNALWFILKPLQQHVR